MEIRSLYVQGPQEKCSVRKFIVPWVAWHLLLLLQLMTINHHNCLQQTHLTPPNRTLPAELIVLENGSTTLVSSSSLEEFLDSTTAAPSAPTSARNQYEHNRSATDQSLSIVTRPASENQQLERESDTRTLVVTGKSVIATQLGPQTSQRQTQSHHDEEHKKQSFFGKAAANGAAAPKVAGTSGTSAASNGSSSPPAPKPIPQHWQVKSLLNVTHDYPLEYSQIICGYVWPLMAAITMFTNLMIVFVLTQRDMRTPTNVVLTAIAIADIIPILVPVPWFVYLFAMGNEKQVLYPPIACYFYQHSTRSVSEIFYFLSTWLNVLLAVQDYLTACWPKLAKKYCQIRVVIIEIVVLTLLAFLLNLPQALKLVFKPVKFYYQGQLTWGCRALQAKWFKDLVGEYVALYDDIFTAIIVVFVDGGPAIALITLTALLIRQLHRQRIQGHLLMEQARTASKRRRERHRQQEYEASARVMIFVLLAFLAVKIPFATTYTLMIIQSRFEIHFVENLVDFQKAITLTDLVFVLSYPINFTIFCGCSKKFRHKCAQLLGECNKNTKSARNRLVSSFSSSFNSDNTYTSQMYNNHNSEDKTNNNNNNKRDSLGTVLSAKRDSSASLLLSAERTCEYNTMRNSMTTSGNVVCCNGSADRKLSQPQSIGSGRQRGSTCSSNQGDDRQQQPSPPPAPNRMLPSPIFEEMPGGSQESVRALVEDGLCVECIMRYEQMKRSTGYIATSHHSSGHHHHQQQHQHQRRPSTDSGSSWHVSLPPPPPPLQFCMSVAGQQQLPHIVTTRCESIRERSSSEEMNQDAQPSVAIISGGSNDDQLGGPSMLLSRGSQGDCSTHHQHHLNPAPDSGSSGASVEQTAAAANQSGGEVMEPLFVEVAASGSRGRIQARGMVGSSTRGSSDPGTIRGCTVRQQSLGYGYLDEHYLHGRDIRSASHSNESMSSAGFGMDAGNSSGRREGTSLAERGADGGGGKHLRTPKLKQMEDKHRSLSMSNSKLSVLAGATGLLADIIKSTLLTTSPVAHDTLHASSSRKRH